MGAPSGLEALEAIRDGAGPPVGVAELLGTRVATAEGEVLVAGSDRPVATATCTCLVVRP